MEQGKMLLAIVLSLVVFLVWDFFFTERQTPQPVRETSTASPSVHKAPEPAPPQPKIQPQGEPAAAVKAPSGLKVPAGREITINTPLYSVVLSEQGARIRSFKLHKYRQRVEEDAPALELVSERVDGGALDVAFLDSGLAGSPQASYRVDSGSDRIELLEGSQTLNFTWRTASGLEVRKMFRFDAQSYLFDLEVMVRNDSAAVVSDQMTVGLIKEMPSDSARIGFVGPSAMLDGKLEQVKIGDIDERPSIEGLVQWIAIQDRYFLMALIAESQKQAKISLDRIDEDMVVSRYGNGGESISPGSIGVSKFQIFFGPKSSRILAAVGHKLDRTLEFGWFDFIARPCLWFMNFIYGYIPNYGIAIIILTLLTKGLLWPLGSKSYKSMSEMKKIQPLMAEIREKYKGDKKKMNEELMGLYKVYKINPLGGCLPMLVQLPVFIALYRMLYEAIELRHAPFFGWINDLSAPDRLLHFDFAVPFMEAPYGIPVLTLVMGLTMFLQQKMSPPVGDPTQAKVMAFMPLIFTFIFINFSSGLVLYWLVNNIISISQQYFITKKYA